MSRKNGKDYLFLIWKQPESRRQYVVGILSKNGGFEFAYAEDIDEARKNGFSGIEAFKAVAQAKDKKLEINVDEGISYVGDEKAIRQLISILIDNAIKYSESSISITLKTSGRNRMITVWNTVDESANIKKGRQDILFERFYRADPSHNSKTGGFGIGLSAAYAIVRAHKGRISARSEDGRSIEFLIVL